MDGQDGGVVFQVVVCMNSNVLSTSLMLQGWGGGEVGSMWDFCKTWKYI